MATTPEGKVKKMVREYLESINAYYFMPVQTGYGKRGLDFHCCIRGFAVFIETKAPGKKLKVPQQVIVREMCDKGGRVFIVDGEESLKRMVSFIENMGAAPWFK